MKTLINLIGLLFIVSCNKTLPTHVRLVYNPADSNYSVCDSTGTSLFIADQVISGKTMTWYNIGGSRSGVTLTSEYSITGGEWGILRDMHTPEQDHQIITEPVFDSFLPFGENVAAARVANLWGFVDTLGQWIIPAQFDTAHMKPVTAKGWYASFLNGTAWVNQNGKAFRIDRNGRPMGSRTYHIDPRFVYIADRFDPLFIFEDYQLLWKATWFEERGQWGILKNDETVLMPPSVQEPTPFYPFREGAAWLSKDSKFGLWKDGRWIITPQFDCVRVYPSHAWVNVGGCEEEYDFISSKFTMRGGAWGLIDTTGKVIIQPAKEKVEFGGEYVPVKHNGQWLYFWKEIFLESPIPDDDMNDKSENMYFQDGIRVSGSGAEKVAKDIRKFLDIKWNDLYSCYQTEQKEHPGLKGKLRVAILLTRAGRVKQMTIKENTLGDNISQCVQSKIGKWIFPVQGQGELSFEQVYVFTP